MLDTCIYLYQIEHTKCPKSDPLLYGCYKNLFPISRSFASQHLIFILPFFPQYVTCVCAFIVENGTWDARWLYLWVFYSLFYKNKRFNNLRRIGERTAGLLENSLLVTHFPKKKMDSENIRYRLKILFMVPGIGLWEIRKE